MNNNWKIIKKEEFKKIFNSKNNSVVEILKNQTIDEENKIIIEFYIKLKEKEGIEVMEKYVLKTEFDPFKKEMYVFKQEMYEFKEEMYEFKEEMYEFKKETNNRLDRIEELLYINTKQIQELTIKVDKLADEIVNVNLRIDTEMKKINDRLDNELGQLNLNIAEINSKLNKLEL
ncbi:hypothetical protein [Malacoplasma iowae]|uniref:hypothetical protein n=1 Tax=Malacoplasma iowae TaxID=2116 RepID=UPI003872AC6F|nr:hypothetical protein QX181_05000 [Malacoplasma iowae]